MCGDRTAKRSRWHGAPAGAMHASGLALLALLLSACGEPPPDEAVLARVGDAYVTAEEFQLNFEFGHGHLRQGQDVRRAYLDLMIREKALALEARKIRLDTAQTIVHAMHTLREELLIERVFEEHVLGGVEVTDDEIREEINRAAVSIRFRFLPAATREEAAAIRELIGTHGYERALDQAQNAFSELDVIPGELTSPLLSAEDIEPGILDILDDLEINTPSEPVEYGGHWYVFEVIDIQRRPVAASDYERLADRYEQVIYNRKAMELGQAFVAGTMQPLNVVTKRQGFELLNEALWLWYSAETPTRNLLHYIMDERRDTPYTRLLVSAFDADLVHFGDERWSVRSFLENFTPGRYSLRARDPVLFKARLADVVALVVRDAIFLEMASDERLHETPEFRRTLAQWKDKWMFQEYAKLLLGELPVAAASDKGGARDHGPQARAGAADPAGGALRAGAANGRTRRWLAHYADSVASGYGISVNTALLDSLPLSHTESRPGLTVHLLKSNSNKMPFPIVDPGWIAVAGEGQYR